MISVVIAAQRLVAEGLMSSSNDVRCDVRCVVPILRMEQVSNALSPHLSIGNLPSTARPQPNL